MEITNGRLLRPAELRVRGFTDGEFRRRRRARELAAVRRGAYVLGGDERLRTPASRHALLVEATTGAVHPDAVVSHVSAAVLHGLPVWGAPLDRVHLTRHRRSGARRGGVAHVHAASLAPGEITVVRGIPVTTVARTVVDIARSASFEAAVVTADAALRVGVDPDELRDVLARGARRPGQPGARRVVAFADGRSESPGESRSRALLHLHHLPPPELQRPVWSAEGHFLGRVDLWWEGRRTVGEFDGLVKYGRSLSPGQDPTGVLVAEKRREDALRDSGLQVVRWMWDELEHFVVVVRRLQRAFDRAGRARPASDGRAARPPPAMPPRGRQPPRLRDLATSRCTAQRSGWLRSGG